MTNSIAQAHVQARHAVCPRVFRSRGAASRQKRREEPCPREQEPAPGGPPPGHAHLRPLRGPIPFFTRGSARQTP